jgi:hypothetical protein
MTLTPLAMLVQRARLTAALAGKEVLHAHLTVRGQSDYPQWTLVFHPDRRVCGTERCIVLIEETTVDWVYLLSRPNSL